MKVYIWNKHAVVVAAHSEIEARALVRMESGVWIDSDEEPVVIGPDHITEPTVYQFKPQVD